MKIHKWAREMLLVVILFVTLTVLYLFPLIQGLVLLPLDMLVSNYAPWYSPGQILVKNLYMQDSIIQMFPWKHLVFQSLQNFTIPFWNPYQFLGMPFMASMKPMVFYPFNILYIFGEVNAWNVLLFFQIFLSLAFMYLLARSFKLKPLPSILVSLAFGLNTLMMSVLEFGSEGHVLLWLPLFILCAKKYLEKQKGIYLFLLGITTGVSIFAGQLQYTGYAMSLVVAFILFYGHSLKTRITTYLYLLSALALGIGVSAIQLIPSIELFSHSFRGIADSHRVFVQGLNKPYQLLRLFAPDIFGNPVTHDATIGYIESSGYFGIIPLFFALFAIVFAQKNIFVKFFTWTGVIAALLSLQGIGQILSILHIPLITSGEGDRIFVLVYFSGALLAGFGLTEFISSKNRLRNIASLCVFALVFVSALAGTAVLHHGSSSSINAFIHNIQFVATIFFVFFIGACCAVLLGRARTIVSILFLVFVVCLTYVDLFRLGYRFLTFSNRKFLYPEMNVTKFVRDASQTTLARNIGLTEPDLATYLNVYTLETYNPLYPLRNAQLLQTLQRKPIKPLPQNKYFLTKGENLKDALDFLGVSLIVSNKDLSLSKELFKSTRFDSSLDLIYKDDRYAVYRNTGAFPRFGVYYQAQQVSNDAEALDLLSQNPLEFRNKLIVEDNLPVTLDEGRGSARLLSSSLNTQQFTVTTNKPALFYVSDTYFPGWSATVNNQATKIYRVNYNLRAVLVPAGWSKVEFSYVPSGFILGALTSVFSLSGLTFILILHKSKRLQIARGNIKKTK